MTNLEALAVRNRTEAETRELFRTKVKAEQAYLEIAQMRTGKMTEDEKIDHYMKIDAARAALFDAERAIYESRSK